MLDAHGLSPTHSLGQNFLIDGNLMGKLLASADLEASDTVLEVGPGTGSLTEMLLERAGHVVAVELDRGLFHMLNDRLDSWETLTLLHGDILRTKSCIEPRVLDLLGASQRALRGRVCLVANLPYGCASPFLIDLLLSGLRLDLACFTVQKDVGDRILARPGGKVIGPLSIILQSGGAIERTTAIPPQAFWPQPKVDSVMLRMVPRPDRSRLPHLARVVHACFLHRRKTLRYNLVAAFGTEVARLAETGAALDLTRRPETLSVEEWERLTALIPIDGPDGTAFFGPNGAVERSPG